MAFKLQLSDLPPEKVAPQFKLSLADLPQAQTPTLGQRALAQGKQIIGNINDIGGGLVHGLSYPFARALNFTGDALANLPVADHIQILKSIAHGLQHQRALTAPDYHPQHLAAQIGNIGGQLATPIPEADIGEAVGIANPLIKNLINRLGTNSAIGALYSKPNHAVAGALTGGATGEVLNPLFHAKTAVSNLARKLVNSHLANSASEAAQHYVGARSPEEVAALNKQLGDLPVNIGEVLGNAPAANLIYQAGKYLPGAGAKKASEKLVGNVDKYANDLMGELSGGSEAKNVPSEIQAAVKQNYKEHQGISKHLYNIRDSIAEQNGAKIPLNNFQKTAQKIQKDSGELWKKTPETNHLNNIINQLNENAPDGSIDFKNAHFANSGLKKDSRNFEKQQNYHGKSLMDSLSTALDSDMQNAAQEIPGLNEAHQMAQSHFKENILPYRSKAIQNIMSGKSNLKNINGTLLSNNDVSKKVLSDLDDPTKNKILYNAALRNAKPNEANVLKTTPALLQGAYDKLTADEKNRLVSPQLQQKFNKLKALNKVSQTARARISPPMTGFQAVAPLIHGEEGYAIGKAAKKIGALKSLAFGVPAYLASRGAANEGLKYLYSPEIREAYAKGGLPLLSRKALTGTQKTLKKGAILALNKAINGGGNS